MVREYIRKFLTRFFGYPEIVIDNRVEKLEYRVKTLEELVEYLMLTEKSKTETPEIDMSNLHPFRGYESLASRRRKYERKSLEEFRASLPNKPKSEL